MPSVSASALPNVSARSGLRRWVFMLAGTVLLAAGVAALVSAGIGTGPIDALVYGLSVRTGVSLTLVSVTISVVFLAGAWLWGVRPGPGTVVSMLLFGPLFEAALWLAATFLHPAADPGSLAVAWVEWFAGVLLIGAGSSLMIVANLGVGAYDAATLALCRRFTWTVPRARLVLDVTVLVLALLVGGPIGFGTLGLALTMPLVLRVFVPLAGRLLRLPGVRRPVDRPVL